MTQHKQSRKRKKNKGLQLAIPTALIASAVLPIMPDVVSANTSLGTMDIIKQAKDGAGNNISLTYTYEVFSTGEARLNTIVKPSNVSVISEIIIDEEIEYESKKYIVTQIHKEQGSRNILGYSNFTVQKITMPDTIKNINPYAFSDVKLPPISLPKNIEVIGSMAFSYSNFTTETGELNLNSYGKLKTIGGDAFRGNTLTKIVIPQNIVLSRGAFNNSSSIRTIVIEEGVQDIPQGLFQNIGQTRDSIDITLPTTLKTIEEYAFTSRSRVGETSITINGNNLKKIYNNAFSGLNIVDVSLPDSVDYIGDYVFDTNPKLTMSKLPTSLEVIGGFAFRGTSISLRTLEPLKNLKIIGDSAFRETKRSTEEELILPSSLEKIGKHAFYMGKIEGAVVLPNSLNDVGAGVFMENSISSIDFTGASKLEEIPFEFLRGNKIKELKIPSNIKKIGYSSLRENLELTNLVIDAPLTAISTSAFESTSLTGHIKIPDTVTKIESYAFRGIKNKDGFTVELPEKLKEIDVGAFENSVLNNHNFEIPEGVHTIGSSAFYETKLTGELKLPSTLKTIGSSAFYRVQGITGKLVIPENVETIGYSAFYNLNKVTEIEDNSKVTAYPKDVFAESYAITKIKLADNLKSIEKNALSGLGYTLTDGVKVNVKIPPNVVSIGEYAFSDKNYKSNIHITFNDKLEIIGSYAFSNTGLDQDLILPDSVKNIGSYAFSDNISLGNLRLPDNISILAWNVFKNNRIDSVYLPESLTEVGYYTFQNVTGDAFRTLKLPENLKEVGGNAFGNAGIEELILNEKLIRIGSNAFSDNKIKVVDIPKSVNSISDSAFRDNQIHTLKLPNTPIILGENAFKSNNLTEIILSDSVKFETYAIESPHRSGGVFRDNNITTITVDGNNPNMGGSYMYFTSAVNRANVKPIIKTYRNTPLHNRIKQHPNEGIFHAIDNDAPTIEPIHRQKVAKNGTVTIDLKPITTDIDNDPVTFKVLKNSNPQNVTPTIINGVLSIKGVKSGTSEVTIEADDGVGGLTTETFTVEVENEPPVVTKPLDVTITGVGKQENFLIEATDIDSSNLTYRVTIADTSKAKATIDKNKVIITGVRKGNTIGTVHVSDGNSTVSQDFAITVANSAPTVTHIPTQLLDSSGATRTFDLSTYFKDIDNDLMVYTATTNNNKVVDTNTHGNVLTLEATGRGTAEVTVTATDTDGATTTMTFNVEVGNQKPVTAEIPNQEFTSDGEEKVYKLPDYITDDDNDNLTYQVQIANKNIADVKIEGDNLKIKAKRKGKTEVTIIASDGIESATLTFNINVLNTKPTLLKEKVDDVLSIGEDYRVYDLYKYFEDKDNDQLYFSITANTNLDTKIDEKGKLYVKVNQTGVHTATVRATDAYGAYVEFPFQATAYNSVPIVEFSNLAPTNQDIIMTVTPKADTAKIFYAINGAEQEYSSPVSIKTNGFVTVRSIGVNGEEVKQQFTISNIDKTPPTLPLADIPSNLTNKSITAKTTFSEDAVTRQYKLNNGVWADVAPDGDIIITDSGTLTLRAVDAVGNAIENTYTISNINKIKPTITTNIVAGQEYASNFLPSIYAEDDTGIPTTTIKLNGVQVSDTYGYVDGKNTIEVKAVDKHGNETIQEVTFYIKKAPQANNRELTIRQNLVEEYELSHFIIDTDKANLQWTIQQQGEGVKASIQDGKLRLEAGEREVATTLYLEVEDAYGQTEEILIRIIISSIEFTARTVSILDKVGVAIRTEWEHDLNEYLKINAGKLPEVLQYEMEELTVQKYVDYVQGKLSNLLTSTEDYTIIQQKYKEYQQQVTLSLSDRVNKFTQLYDAVNERIAKLQLDEVVNSVKQNEGVDGANIYLVIDLLTSIKESGLDTETFVTDEQRETITQAMDKTLQQVVERQSTGVSSQQLDNFIKKAGAFVTYDDKKEYVKKQEIVVKLLEFEDEIDNSNVTDQRLVWIHKQIDKLAGDYLVEVKEQPQMRMMMIAMASNTPTNYLGSRAQDIQKKAVSRLMYWFDDASESKASVSLINYLENLQSVILEVDTTKEGYTQQVIDTKKRQLEEGNTGGNGNWGENGGNGNWGGGSGNGSGNGNGNGNSNGNGNGNGNGNNGGTGNNGMTDEQWQSILKELAKLEGLEAIIQELLKRLQGIESGATNTKELETIIKEILTNNNTSSKDMEKLVEYLKETTQTTITKEQLEKLLATFNTSVKYNLKELTEKVESYLNSGMTGLTWSLYYDLKSQISSIENKSEQEKLEKYLQEIFNRLQINDLLSDYEKYGTTATYEKLTSLIANITDSKLREELLHKLNLLKASKNNTSAVTPTLPIDVSFIDTKGHWAEQDILYLAKKGIVLGSNGVFAPNAAITRAQFAAILARALGVEAKKASQFTDVKGKWYEGYVQAIYELGVTTGVTPTLYKPNDTLTRQQVIAMLGRLLDSKKIATPSSPISFKDMQEVSEYAKPHVEKLVSIRAIHGDKGNLKPKSKLTRAQMAKITAQVLRYIEK